MITHCYNVSLLCVIFIAICSNPAQVHSLVRHCVVGQHCKLSFHVLSVKWYLSGTYWPKGQSIHTPLKKSSRIFNIFFVRAKRRKARKLQVASPDRSNVRLQNEWSHIEIHQPIPEFNKKYLYFYMNHFYIFMVQDTQLVYHLPSK